MFYSLARSLMFCTDAEFSHHLALGSLKHLKNTPASLLWRQDLPKKPVTVAGIHFDNPVGLAAGLDKNADCIDAFGQMGFGFIEVGTVTPRPQVGNDKPRLFRLPEANAIINRMGFNNKGVDYLVENVKKAYFGVLVNQERIRLAEANMARIDTLLKETKALNDAGFAEKIDVSRIQVQRNNIYTQVQRSLTALEISKQILKVQMGMPLEYDVTLSESLRDLTTQEDLAKLLVDEGTERVEIQQISTQLELTGLDLKNNHAQYMPKINLVGNARRSGAGNEWATVFSSDNWFGSSLIGVSMSVPIFDGFAKAARIQKNRVQINQLENQRLFLKESFKSELYTAKANLKNDLSILEVQEENLKLAQEVFQIARIKYNEGIGSNLEVVEADASLIEAEINYLGALYDGLISKVNLEKALGLLKTDLTN